MKSHLSLFLLNTLTHKINLSNRTDRKQDTMIKYRCEIKGLMNETVRDHHVLVSTDIKN